MSQSKKLTDKQARFVEEYLIDTNATQAAIRAGYSAKTAKPKGNELKKHPAIAAAIEAGLANLSERCQVTQDDVIRGLLTEAEWQGEGSSHSARVSAWEKLGKHLGMFKDKVEHTGADGGPIVTANLTPDQVIERMKELDDEY